MSKHLNTSFYLFRENLADSQKFIESLIPVDKKEIEDYIHDLSDLLDLDIVKICEFFYCSSLTGYNTTRWYSIKRGDRTNYHEIDMIAHDLKERSSGNKYILDFDLTGRISPTDTYFEYQEEKKQIVDTINSYLKMIKSTFNISDEILNVNMNNPTQVSFNLKLIFKI